MHAAACPAEAQQRHLVFLEQRVHLKAGVHLQEPAKNTEGEEGSRV
jgi:hypothetical protein